jgi:hypothetical protein
MGQELRSVVGAARCGARHELRCLGVFEYAGVVRALPTQHGAYQYARMECWVRWCGGVGVYRKSRMGI